jgi:16S rRNA (guanine966-N2)-methyltransferase
VARKRKSPTTSAGARPATDRDAEVRIIGGTFRGRRLSYHGDPVVRPMKHRTREAIFNLISTECTGRHAIDLFAGTGALGLEALSRGAQSATFIEKHVPSARGAAHNECVPLGQAGFGRGRFRTATRHAMASVLQSTLRVLL